MLNLTRRRDQKIIIEHRGEIIEILVTKVDRGCVGLGITAPKSANIVRAELLPPKEKHT